VAANLGVARTGTLAVAGQTFTVNQTSGCTYSINPKEQSINDAGGRGTGRSLGRCGLRLDGDKQRVVDHDHRRSVGQR
jgi:hypothetical protein